MNKKTNAWDDESHDSKKGKELTPDVSSLIVRIIEDDSNYLHKTLGINKENSKRLQDLIYDQLQADQKNGVAKTNTSTLMVKISEHCKHANELAFACFALGKITSELGKEDRGHRGSRRSGPTLGGAIAVNRQTGEIKHIGMDGEDAGDMPDFIKDIIKDILGKRGKRDDRDDEFRD